MKTIDVIWFNNKNGCYGVVLAQNDHYQMAYFSIVSGMDLKIDIDHIKEWGVKLDYNQAFGFFGPKVKKEIYKTNLKKNV